MSHRTWISLADEVKQSISSWLDEMASGLELGRFRFCKKGSLVPTAGHQAQFVTCFAIKSAWHMGLWEEWSQVKQEACVQFIQSFQREDGYFVDDGMLRRMVFGSALGLRTFLRIVSQGKFSEWKQDIVSRAIRAETRQSAATLRLVQANIPYCLPLLCPSKVEVQRYIRALSWTNPWGAGSHASHLIVFLHTNRNCSERSEDHQALIETAFNELDNLRDSQTGAWGEGHVEPHIKLNGAMKVLTAYKWTGRPLEQAEKLIDLALSQPFQGDGCGFLNQLFVLRESSVNCPGYRESEIRDLAMQALNAVRKFRQADGAFSFYQHSAQRGYYGAWVSLGGQQSDMHGTVMMTWACALCFELLGIANELGWRSSWP